MDISDIKKLAEVHGNPAVSILCRLDRHRPGNLEDPRRLDALRKAAIDAVLKIHDQGEVEPVLTRLDDAVDSVDLAHPSDAVAILVTAEESHVLALPFPVFSRVVVDDTFATRDLVTGAGQALRARVLVLAAERARCFEVTGHALREVHGHGFPLHVSPPVQEDTPHRDLPIGEHEHAEAHRYVLRAVDAALTELQARDHRPIVVVAPVRELAYFDEVTRFAKDIIGRVHGNHVEDSVTGIERVVEPALAAELARRSEDAVRRANEAVGKGAATGFGKVAAAARAGRGHELIVDEDLHLEMAANEGPDDPVDEVIEAVLTHDGKVTTVPRGALADHGGIVLILRY
jgi:Bacterial archaeo-eukaryotic release factor family 3